MATPQSVAPGAPQGLDECEGRLGEEIIISGGLKQITDGHYQVLLATGQIFGEGMHIENIEALVLAFPFAFEGKLTQYVGRLLHSASPKILIDYHDRHIPFLDRQFKQRRRAYKKLLG